MIITIPTSPGFTRSQFQLNRRTGVAFSPFTGTAQVQSYPDYALWEAVLTLPPMRRGGAAQWQAFFAKLKGRANTFYLGDPDGLTKQGGATSSHTAEDSLGDEVAMYRLASAASARDTTISIKDITNANNANVFKAGDYIQIGNELKMVVDDVVSDGTGTADVTFEPPLRNAYPTDSVVNFTTPRGEFRMVSDTLGWSANHVSTYGITFACIEAV